MNPIRRTRTLTRAFTLLEMMLAMVLGALVVGACLSLFRVLDRSQVRQERRMHENMQIARAHKVIGAAWQGILVASGSSEKDIDAKLEEDDARNSEDRADQRDEDAESARIALQPDPAVGAMMAVATDRGERMARAQSFIVTLRGSPVALGEDKSELELERAEFEKAIILRRALEKSGTSASKAAKELGLSTRSGGSAIDSERAGEAGTAGGRGGTRGSSSRRSTGGKSLGDAQGLVNQALSGVRTSGDGKGSGLSRSSSSSDADDLTASERLEEEQLSKPRAPGVRGVFEIFADAPALNPDGSPSTSAANLAPESDGPLYSLWWRELPPLVADEDLAAEGVALDAEDLTASERAASGSRSSRSSGKGKDGETYRADRSSGGGRTTASDRAAAARRERADTDLVALAAEADFTGKRELLLSGCKSIHWSALRGKRPRDKITAAYDRELPAYVELQFETAAGRREQWMFEVAWVIGPEPGSILPDAPDALNTFAANAGDPNDPNNPNNLNNQNHLDPNQQNNPNNPNVTDPNNPNNPNSPLHPNPKPGQINNPSILKPGMNKPQ